MTWTAIWLILIIASVLMFVLERSGMPSTVELQMKGDLKRETRWFAQYGQSACTPVAALLVWELDPLGGPRALAIGVAVTATALISMLLKRLLGRVRPNREHAGQFLGLSFKHANYRESFPSSHSACAAALSGMLGMMYPHASATFWALALICAGLRWALEAHWPSDVLVGLALGLAVAHFTWTYFPHS